ncbi:unnamed protein product, partial [marine sediment metagenome]
ILDKGLDIHFWIMGRSDIFNKSGNKLIQLLKNAGLWGVFWGVEFGTNRQLRLYNKPVSIEQNINAINLLKRNDLIVEIGFIMFHPYVTFDDLKKNAEFLLKVNESHIWWYFASRLELYPGASIIKKLKRENLLLSKYDYTRIYGYKFRTRKMHRLVNVVTTANNYLKNYDNLIWNINQITPSLKNIMFSNNSNFPLKNKLFDIISSLNQIKTNIGRTNYEFFLKYIELCKKANKVDMKTFIEVHIMKQKCEINKLNALVSLLRKIIKKIPSSTDSM